MGRKDRTHRKYRKLLQDHFAHALFPGVQGVIEEVPVGDERYLRFIQGSEAEEGRKDFLARGQPLNSPFGL